MSFPTISFPVAYTSLETTTLRQHYDWLSGVSRISWSREECRGTHLGGRTACIQSSLPLLFDSQRSCPVPLWSVRINKEEWSHPKGKLASDCMRWAWLWSWQLNLTLLTQLLEWFLERWCIWFLIHWLAHLTSTQTLCLCRLCRPHYSAQRLFLWSSYPDIPRISSWYQSRCQDRS